MSSSRTVCQPWAWLGLLCVCGMWSACNLNPGLEPEPAGEDAGKDRSDNTTGGVDATEDTRSQDALPDQPEDAVPDQALDVAADIPSAMCGDSVVGPFESCDDGNTQSDDGCDGLCQVEDGYACAQPGQPCSTVCGDGIVVAPEMCDDSNQTSSDGCDEACALEPGYTCSGAPSFCEPTCGDGVILGAEACDDSNQTGGDGCDDLCRIEDGFVCPTVGQPCAPVLRVRGNPNQTQDVLWPAGAPMGVTGEARCDDGSMIVGFLVENGPVKSTVEIMCGHVDLLGNVLGYMGLVDSFRVGDRTGSGGSGLSCSDSRVARGARVQVNDMEEIVGFGLFCSRLLVRQEQIAFNPSSSSAQNPRMVGQTTSTLRYDLFCPAGQIPVGLSGLFTGTDLPRQLHRLGLICDAATLEF